MNESTEPGNISSSNDADPASNRIGRWSYLARLCCIYLAIQLAGLSPSVWLGAIVLGFFYYIHLSIRRLNDLNLSGWFVLLLGLPIINIVLLILPGSGNTNRFGPPPAQLSKREITLTVISILLTISLLIVTYVLIVGPAFERYRAAVL